MSEESNFSTFCSKINELNYQILFNDELINNFDKINELVTDYLKILKKDYQSIKIQINEFFKPFTDYLIKQVPKVNNEKKLFYPRQLIIIMSDSYEQLIDSLSALNDESSSYLLKLRNGLGFLLNNLGSLNINDSEKIITAYESKLSSILEGDLKEASKLLISEKEINDLIIEKKEDNDVNYFFYDHELMSLFFKKLIKEVKPFMNLLISNLRDNELFNYADKISNYTNSLKELTNLNNKLSDLTNYLTESLNEIALELINKWPNKNEIEDLLKSNELVFDE